MSVENNVINGIINNALMQTHTAFCGKVLSVSGNFAKVQPLNMVKAVGGVAQKQAVIPKVPILQPTYKIKEIRCTGDGCEDCSGKHETEWEYQLNIAAGDTVFCVCAERDITETRKGKFALPVQGRHMLSDAVIVGKF